MLSFANASDSKLVNRPDISVIVKFYRNQRARWKLSHSALYHSTTKQYKLRRKIRQCHVAKVAAALIETSSVTKVVVPLVITVCSRMLTGTDRLATQA